jgi:4-hydroxyphenylpyruvate dioxygenase-like putative hemolysin
MATGKKLSNDKAINGICQKLMQAGWVARTTGKHPQLKSPCGTKRLTINKTPTDHHAVKNFMADIKRAGIEVPA